MLKRSRKALTWTLSMILLLCRSEAACHVWPSRHAHGTSPAVSVAGLSHLQKLRLQLELGVMGYG